MCEHGTTRRMAIGGKVVGVDECIADIVSALNRGGVPTVASCCGHGLMPGTIILGDDRWLVITDREAALAIVAKAMAG